MKSRELFREMEKKAEYEHPLEEQLMEITELQTTLTFYQVLMLFQTKRLANVDGEFLSARMAHGMQANYITEDCFLEQEWLRRAQAKALERLGLVTPEMEKTRWRLTPKGKALVMWYREQIQLQLHGV